MLFELDLISGSAGSSFGSNGTCFFSLVVRNLQKAFPRLRVDA